jgi:hypothetical protein
MKESTRNRPKSFKVYYLASAFAVAVTAVLAVVGSLRPSLVLPGGVETEVAVFLVPLALLLIALLAEAAHAAWRGAAPLDPVPQVRRISQWAPGRGEG